MLQRRIYGVVKTVDDLAEAQLNLTKVTKVRLRSAMDQGVPLHIMECNGTKVQDCTICNVFFVYSVLQHYNFTT